VVVDASGTVTGECRYLAYGGTRAISGSMATRYGFLGCRDNKGWAKFLPQERERMF
jgi:hypothetical protein